MPVYFQLSVDSVVNFLLAAAAQLTVLEVWGGILGLAHSLSTWYNYIGQLYGSVAEVIHQYT